MKKIYRIINSIINIGITNNPDDFTINKNTKVSNLFSFSALNATIFFIFFDVLIRQKTQIACFDFCCIFAYCSILLLNKLGKRNYSRVLCFLLGLTQLFVLTYLNGYNSGIPLYFMYGITLLFLMFSKKEFVKIIVGFIILLSLFIIAEYLFSDLVALYPTGELTLLTKGLHSIVVIILVISGVNHFNSDVRNTTNLLQEQVDKHNYLLNNIYPRSIAKKIKDKEKNKYIKIKDINKCTVLYADIVQFTSFSKGMNAEKLVELLNELFTMFDDNIKKNGTEKIKTIGDAYVIASGIPSFEKNYPEKVLLTAIDMIKSIKEFNKKFDYNISIRIGIASGHITSGICGNKKFSYEIMGEALDLAMDLEETCQVNKIHIHKNLINFLSYKYYNFTKSDDLEDAFYLASDTEN